MKVETTLSVGLAGICSGSSRGMGAICNIGGGMVTSNGVSGVAGVIWMSMFRLGSSGSGEASDLFTAAMAAGLILAKLLVFFGVDWGAVGAELDLGGCLVKTLLSATNVPDERDDERVSEGRY
jgi:hypothetical protein